MAPQAPDAEVKDPLLPDEDLHPHHHEHVHRELKFDIKEIITGLRELDWSKVVWRNLILFVLLHIYSAYGVYLALVHAQWKTIFFSVVLYFMAALGITMGAHRLWSHRSFKAKAPLRLVLAVFQTIAFQNDIYEWARDHRVHHKYSETDADPHNARRGFFFSHMGWLMLRKHPAVIEKGKGLDLSDLKSDPIVMWQRKYYLPSVVTACFVLPTFIPCYYWAENLVTSLMVAGFLRYTIVLHITWCVNSLAHWVGSKPYDKSIYPSQNPVVAYLALGEGWHNYHHVFPWDYRTAELGGLVNYNITCLVIDFCQWIGQAYDLRTVKPELVEKRINRTGDGTYVPLTAKTITEMNNETPRDVPSVKSSPKEDNGHHPPLLERGGTPLNKPITKGRHLYTTWGTGSSNLLQDYTSKQQLVKGMKKQHDTYDDGHVISAEEAM